MHIAHLCYGTMHRHQLSWLTGTGYLYDQPAYQRDRDTQSARRICIPGSPPVIHRNDIAYFACFYNRYTHCILGHDPMDEGLCRSYRHQLVGVCDQRGRYAAYCFMYIGFSNGKSCINQPCSKLENGRVNIKKISCLKIISKPHSEV